MKEKKEKETNSPINVGDKAELQPPPEVTLRGRDYKFQDLTVEQMEIVAELLDDARVKVREEFMKNVDGFNAAKNLTVKVADIFANLTKEKKLAKFLAAVMTQQPDCEPFQSGDIHARTADFSVCPFDKAQEIFGFFFTTGMFWSLIFPNFSARPRVEAVNRES